MNTTCATCENQGKHHPVEFPKGCPECGRCEPVPAEELCKQPQCGMYEGHPLPHGAYIGDGWDSDDGLWSFF